MFKNKLKKEDSKIIIAVVICCIAVALIIAFWPRGKTYPTIAMVNGQDLTAWELTAGASLDQVIDNAVMAQEAKRVGTTVENMVGFFDSLRTRKIPKDQLESFMHSQLNDKDLKEDSRAEILQLMREKQYAEAKKRYLSELKSRSTIWIMKDGQKVKYEEPQEPSQK